MLKLVNLRLGNPTNSSSSHSIVLLNDNAEIVKTDDCMEDFIGHADFEYRDFLLLNKVEKVAYLLAPILKTILLRNSVQATKNFLNLFVKGIEFTDEELETILDFSEEYKVDDYHLTTYMSNEFITRNPKSIRSLQIFIQKLLISEKIGIYGDYEADEIYIASKEEELAGYVGLRVFDMSNGVIILTTWAGLSIKFSYNDDEELVMSKVPDLIDVKITERCNYGCPYCYQSATTTGKEISLEKLEQFIAQMDKVNVFDLAIGGGDPTQQMFDLFESDKFNNQTIQINFTSRNFDRIKDFFALYGTHKNFGAIGYSCSPTQFLTLSDNMFFAVNNKYKFALQLVMGIQSSKEELLNELTSIKRCLQLGIRVVLLSYKDFGFGQSIKPIEYIDELAKFINKEKSLINETMLLDLDTPLVNELSKTNLDFWGVTFNSVEGISNCYLDLTQEKIGLSSYSNELLNFKFDDLMNNTIDQFNKRMILLGK